MTSSPPENPAAAAQLEKDLLEPEWRYSKATATFDYERGVSADYR
ncbi:hypothetical protein GCM10010211_34250 [Streptomyces albospinus]|uniref:Uncharacterized protein n=1 Tax=Streptomyces albospinus TaxID=285515 RepID=A0ABQ2V2R6_9ACTN|nr:hypothetical protein [Streptomyces albospinus]GGU66139.1 hypothetical protein GCM10010211_34250 [Streptomyces albospinus]